MPTIKTRTNAVKNKCAQVLSERRDVFKKEIHRIEGKANHMGGGEASFGSGILVGRFIEEIEAEVSERARLVRLAMRDALDLQSRSVGSALAKSLKHELTATWMEGLQDISAWYEKRVSKANSAVAAEHPLEATIEKATGSLFVDIENRRLAPGFWSRNWKWILSGVGGLFFGLAKDWLSSLIL